MGITEEDRNRIIAEYRAAQEEPERLQQGEG